MRDSCRQRVYDAENEVFGDSSEQMTVKEMQEFVNRVLSSKKIQKRYRRARYKPTVTDGRGRRRGGYTPGYNHAEIKMPKFTRSKWYLIHELAHHLSYCLHEPWHGPKFCEAYIHLVSVYIGKDEAKALRAAFRSRNVEWAVIA